MIITEFIFVMLSLIAGLSTYCFINKELPNVCYRIESYLAFSATVIGMFGTVAGFFIAVSGDLDKASTILGLSTALPTTMAGIITGLYCGFLACLKPNKVKVNEQ
jgi:LytS/YehU family sensor histidine kinase